MKPTIEAFKMGPKNGEPFRSPLTALDLIVRTTYVKSARGLRQQFVARLTPRSGSDDLRHAADFSRTRGEKKKEKEEKKKRSDDQDHAAIDCTTP